MSTFGDHEVGLVLDGENFPPPRPNFVANISASLRTVDRRFTVSGVKFFSCHTRKYTRGEDTALITEGFKYYTAPLISRRCDICPKVTPGEPRVFRYQRNLDIADSILIEELLGRAIENKLPPNLLVFTSDIDFNETLYNLHKAGYKILICKRVVAPVKPLPFASATFDCDQMQNRQGAAHVHAVIV